MELAELAALLVLALLEDPWLLLEAEPTLDDDCEVALACVLELPGRMDA